MTNIQVLCVIKQPRRNPYEGIAHLEGVETEDHSRRWRWSREGMVADIDYGVHDFWTWCNGKWATVRAVHAESGRPWVQTDDDRETCSNLLNFPECV